MMESLRSNLVQACDGERITLQCPKNTQILLENVFYGRLVPSDQLCPSSSTYHQLPVNEDISCDVVQAQAKIMEQCRNKRKCKMLVKPSFFDSDPCPDTPKYLQISYKWSTMRLNCKQNKRLVIYSARYGRTAKGQAMHCTPNTPVIRDCVVDVLGQMLHDCHAQTECTVLVNDERFGKAGCGPGTQKYLSLIFMCMNDEIFSEAAINGNLETMKKIISDSSSRRLQNAKVSFVKDDERIFHIKDDPGRGYKAAQNNSSRKDKNADFVSNSLLTESHEEPEEEGAFVIAASMDGTSPSIRPFNALGFIHDMVLIMRTLKNNKEKALLCLVVSVLAGLTVLLVACAVSECCRRRMKRRHSSNEEAMRRAKSTELNTLMENNRSASAILDSSSSRICFDVGDLSNSKESFLRFTQLTPPRVPQNIHGSMTSNNVKYPKGCKLISANTANTELLKRLKVLSKTLKGEITNEEAGTPNRYIDLMLHLTDSRFLSNKNKDVQLLLSCCIADLFRVFAPNSPVENSSVLKNVLLFITTVIGNAPDKESSMRQYYVYLLENIAVIETMQLALELGDDAYVILRELIKQSLSSVNEKNADEHIQEMLMGMCSKLLQGVDQISNVVLDAIFFFIVQPQKINNREAYRMARDLIRTNQITLEPYVALLLKHWLETGILEECELISQKKLYDLIYELQKLAPEMISSVLPLLAEQMHSGDIIVRRQAVHLFGNFFGDQNSRMAEDEPEVWDEYVKHFADVNEEIRRICTRDAEDILVFHPELRGQVTDALILRCQDTDENVRLEVLTLVQGLAKRKFEALSERLLMHVIDRIRDKKVRIRHAAIRGLSHLHRVVFSNDGLTNLERSSVSSIFSSIMNHYYQPLPEDRLLTEKIFVSNLIPYKLDEDKRMEILINIFLSMNNYGVKALEQILMKQSFQRRLLRNLVKFIDQSVEPQKGKTIDDIIRVIVDCSPEPAKFSLVFKQFMTHLTNDKQILLSLKYITAKEYTCQKIESAVLEILQRLRESKVSAESVDTMRCLFECCSPLQFDRTAISVLVNKVVTLIKDSIHGTQPHHGHKLIKLLKIVADAYPYCFVNESTLEGLVELIEIENLSEMEGLLGLVISIATELKEHAFLAKNMIAVYMKHCESISLSGTPRAAKYAVRCISRLLNTEQARMKLESIFRNSLLHISTCDPQCCTALKALSSCVEVDAVQFCNELLEILKTKVMDLLLDRGSSINFGQHGDGMSNIHNLNERFGGETVCDENYVEIKKHCLKLVANFLVSVAEFSECDVEPLANNLLKLYSTLLETKGDIFEIPCRQTHMAEFRMIAGSSMLKLATKPRYAKFVTADDIITLSALGYDEESEVRHRFFGKLNKHLIALRLHVEYMGLFALVTLNEDADFQSKIRVLIDANITKRRKYLERSETKEFIPYYQPEYCLAYAIYILAKFPSFKVKCGRELRRMAESIWFLLEIFNTRKEPGSLEFIYNIFKACKIWALCDIGILLMSYRVKNLMKDVESKPLLSKRFFLDMGKANTKVYLPISFVKELKTKKTSIRHQHVDRSKGMTGSLARCSSTNNSRQPTNRSSYLKPGIGSKRAFNETQIQTDPDHKVQTNSLSLNDASNKVDAKRPKFVLKGKKSVQSKDSLASITTLNGIKEVEKQPVPLTGLNTESKPGTSKASPSKRDERNNRGSLEDCDYSPIRPFYISRSPNVVKSAVASREPPFISSTPIVTVKKRRFVLASENCDVQHEVHDEAKVVSTKKVNPENQAKCDKLKKLRRTQKVKVSSEQAGVQIKLEMSGIATRLRSRQQTLVSSPVQRTKINRSKK
uniref:SUEL-type lectin domain-containing protein n=1 Tax=Setaria digitata TaxID=48799 RepID=A0A915PRF6_9BILA